MVLDMYYKEIKQFPIIDANLQVVLAERWQKYGDKEARDMLIGSYQRLVINIARKYTSNPNDMWDLISEGNEGLLKAVDKFDPSKNTTFFTYAYYWAFAFIFKYKIEYLGSIVKLPKHKIADLTKIFRTRDMYFQRYGTFPTNEFIACELSKDSKRKYLPEQVDELIKFYNNTQQLSLDQPVSDEESTLDDFIPDNFDLEYLISKAETKGLTIKLIEKLTERGRDVLKSRFEINKGFVGLGKDNKESLKEIGSRYSITKERVRQLEAMALKEFQKLVEQVGLENFELE